MATIRQQILTKLGERLAKIKISNGYQTDAGKIVYYGRAQEPNPTDLPAINYWDSEEIAEEKYGFDARKVTITIEMLNKDVDDNLPNVANILKADLDKAIYRDPVTNQLDELGEFFGGLASNFTFRNSSIFIFEGKALLGGLVAEYEVSYQQKYGDPNTVGVF